MRHRALRNLPKVTQPVSGRAGIWTCAVPFHWWCRNNSIISAQRPVHMLFHFLLTNLSEGLLARLETPKEPDPRWPRYYRDLKLGEAHSLLRRRRWGHQRNKGDVRVYRLHRRLWGRTVLILQIEAQMLIWQMRKLRSRDRKCPSLDEFGQVLAGEKGRTKAVLPTAGFLVLLSVVSEDKSWSPICFPHAAKGAVAWGPHHSWDPMAPARTPSEASLGPGQRCPLAQSHTLEFWK